MDVHTAGQEFGDFFLTEPDLFPGRASGEPWGTGELRLDLAGGPYRIVGLATDQLRQLSDRFAPRGLPLDERSPDEVVVKVYRASASDFREFEWRGWNMTFDLDPSRDAVRLAGWCFMARLDALPAIEGAVWTGVGPHEETFVGSLENTLRVIVAYRVLFAGGALLHSAAVRTAEGAWLFPGRSGAGKSTLSRLSHERGYEVLSDELNVLWPSPNGLEVERLPFAGDFGRAAGIREWFPLAGLFVLRQGREARRDPVPRAAAVAELAAACPFVNVDPERAARLFENLERLTSEVSVEALTFSLDPDFWDILRRP